MMNEIAAVAKTVTPHQIYLVCDAMTGQDAVNSAREFNSRLELDGVILTKLDGDARGGAALSVKAVTGKHIKFIGVAKKLDNSKPFYPERCQRILGMGRCGQPREKAQEQFDADQGPEAPGQMSGARSGSTISKTDAGGRKMGGFASCEDASRHGAWPTWI